MIGKKALGLIEILACLALAIAYNHAKTIGSLQNICD